MNVWTVLSTALDLIKIQSIRPDHTIQEHKPLPLNCFYRQVQGIVSSIQSIWDEMAKKKRASPAAAASATAQSTAPSDAAAIGDLFMQLQAKGAAWYDKEREGIALIEAFQTALTACRDDQKLALDQSNGALTDVSGLGSNIQMDPLLAEELFAQVRALTADFEALLTDMYAIQERARKRVVAGSASLDDQQSDAMVLRAVDYLQFMAQELAAFEAEFQHVVRLLVCVLSWRKGLLMLNNFMGW